MGNNRFIWAGALGGLAAVVVYLLGRNLLITLLVAIAAFVALALLLKPPARTFTAGGGNQEEIARLVQAGDQYLTGIVALSQKLTNSAIRDRTEEICRIVTRISETLKERPENVPNVRKFYSYYLPTLAGILTKYQRIEESGTGAEFAGKVAGYLDDIKIAMQRLHSNLFEDDMLDMTVEMEVMTNACKQDQLLSDENFELRDGDHKINLTL